MKKSKLTALAPNGQIFTRTTARTYTHVVIGLRSFYIELERCIAEATYQTQYNHPYYTSGEWRGARLTLSPEETAQAESFEAMTPEEFFQEWFNSIAPCRLGIDFNEWGAIGWAGSRELAEKLAKSSLGFARVIIIIVAPEHLVKLGKEVIDAEERTRAYAARGPEDFEYTGHYL